MNKPNSKISKVTSASSQDEVMQSQLSPMIIPSVVRTVSYNVFDFEEPEIVNKAPIRKTPTIQEVRYIDSARSFLLGVVNECSNYSEQCAASCPQLIESAPSKAHKSYQKCLPPRPAPAGLIDLSEYAGRISHCPLKEEMNEEFAAKYPSLGRLKLSRLLTLRERIYKLGKTCDPCVVAIGWSFFMDLLSSKRVKKGTPKLYAAACMLIAYKFYEETHLQESELKLDELIRRLRPIVQKESHQLKDLLKTELQVYAKLHFSLMVDFDKVQMYFQELQRQLARGNQGLV